MKSGLYVLWLQILFCFRGQAIPQYCTQNYDSSNGSASAPARFAGEGWGGGGVASLPQRQRRDPPRSPGQRPGINVIVVISPERASQPALNHRWIGPPLQGGIEFRSRSLRALLGCVVGLTFCASIPLRNQIPGLGKIIPGGVQPDDVRVPPEPSLLPTGILVDGNF